MNIRNHPMGLDRYIAKYMDSTGCTLEEACIQLEINSDEVFKTGI